MADEERAIRPETHALDALIQATLEHARTRQGPHLTDTMLFLGNWQQAIPALVIQDPVLEPVDKLVWMVVMLHARETGGRTAFPSYERLARQANIASTSTISRAIAVLRITRWLTLCATVRSNKGQFKGNVYVLHDEPLPLADALYLDGDYMQFVSRSLAHHHARVRAVAQGVLDSLDEDIRCGEDVSLPVSVLAHRAEAVRALGSASENPNAVRRYFAFTGSALVRLRNAPTPSEAPENNRDQNSKAVANTDNYSSSVSSGSSGSSQYKKTTTTTTPQNPREAASGFSPTSAPLIFPPRLSANQIALAERYLAVIDADLRQPVLDELQGRLASERHGMKPVYDVLRFLYALCRAAQQGEFVANLGLKVAEARLARQPPDPADQPSRSSASGDEQQAAREQGRQNLEQMRRNLGMDKSS